MREVTEISQKIQKKATLAIYAAADMQTFGVIVGQKAMSMKFLQARNPDWACRTFLAKYDENAIWLDDLKPAFGGEKFFFENDPAPAASRRN